MSKFFSLRHYLFGLATLCALCISNSPWESKYSQLLQLPILSLEKIGIAGSMNSIQVMNDLCMVVFFVLVSLEIKKEFIVGVFQNWKCAALPGAAALGGVIVPAVLYAGLQYLLAGFQQGWAIPTATDIAFSLSVLSLFGSQVPISLRLLLVTLAIVDDLCAILIIAGVYTQHLHGLWLGVSVLIGVGLYCLNRSQVRALWPYLLLGIFLWLGILQSGVHPTITGVVLAAALPSKTLPASDAPALRVENYLHPVVDYIILPAFALINAGVPLIGFKWESLYHPIFLGIFVGLVVGKPLGILVGSSLIFKCGIGSLPPDLCWRHLVSLACLGGIGFTMSLFIGMLTFPEGPVLALVRQAILCASLLSALLAWLIFPKASSRKFPNSG